MYYFTDDCLIGIEQIDEEHRRLFQLVREVHDLWKNDFIDDKYDKLCTMIERLEEYADTHFRHEEEYMEQIKHPELELQKKQHLDFGVKMEELGSILGSHDQQELLDDLLAYLVRWLYHHIIGSDLMIGKMKPLEELKKTSYEFTNEYRTNIELIDEEHKELFRIINEVSEMITDELIPDKYDEIVRLLEELKTYTKNHFNDEEEYMRSIQYEGLEAQKVAHEAFINRLDEMNLDEIDAHQEESLHEILAFLAEWLVNHILYMDKKIGQAAQK